MSDLSAIYTTTDEQLVAAELRCTAHPDWWTDADGTSLPDLIKAATDHFRDAHRVHVTDCLCRDQVIDGRCVQPIAIFGAS